MGPEDFKCSGWALTVGHGGDSGSESILWRERTDMKTFITNFVRDEQGQDLIEYTLLLAFVCLASAAVFISAGGNINGIWTGTNSRLATANGIAAS
jgi:Flp pilus assembly pilin Flp